MAMTRKDYALIAAALRKAIKITEPESCVDIAVYMLADALLEDNPNFDRRRFVEAAIPDYSKGDD